MSQIIEKVGHTINLKPLPQVVVRDETGNFKIKVACYPNDTLVQIIDSRRNACVSMGVDTFESFVNVAEELISKGRALEVSSLCVLLYVFIY